MNLPDLNPDHASSMIAASLRTAGMSALSYNTMRLSPSIIDGIDSKVDVPVEKDEAVEKAVRQCTKQWKRLADFSVSETYNLYSSLDLPIFGPSKIDLVLQRLLRIPHEETCDVSLYISALIQKSYDAGNNGFVLHTQDVPLNNLCSRVKGSEGSEEKRLNIRIYGDTGNYTGSSSRWCSVIHEGNAGNFYFHMAYSDKLFISGMIGEAPLRAAEYIVMNMANKDAFHLAIKKIKELPTTSINKRSFCFVDSAGKALETWHDSNIYKKGLE